MVDVASARFVVDFQVGRLLEARVHVLQTVEHVDAFGVVLRETMQRMPSLPCVLCADHRWANPYPQPVTDRLVEMFHSLNTSLERVSIVVGTAKPTLYMQMRRVAREAAHAARQVFQEPEGALEHLAAALTTAELARAREFLAEPPPS
jgi:uncharacterized lipoprotein YmbA